MSIEKADIVSFVNNAIPGKAASADSCDEQIKLVLTDLSYWELLEATDTSQSLADSSSVFTKPTGYKNLVALTLHDGNVWLKPLKPMPGGYKAYREAVSGYSTGLEGAPAYFAEFDTEIFPYPVAGQAYTSRIDYYKNHPQADDDGNFPTIEFGDEYTNCFKYGAAFYVAMRYGLTRYISIWGPIYQAEIDKQRLGHPTQPRIVE